MAATPESTIKERLGWDITPELYQTIRRMWIKHSIAEDRRDLEGLIAYVQRLKGTAKLRPDSKLVITRPWPDPQSRVNGALQLSKGLAKILA